MKKSDERDKRNEILEVAAQFLARYGYSKTSLADIAGALGLTGPALLYYFTSKKQLFEEVVKREGRKVMNRVKKRLGEYPDPGEAIKAYPLVCLEEVKRLFDERGMTRESLASSQAFFKEILDVLEEEEKAVVKGIFEEGVKQGVFDVEDTEVLAMAVVTVVKELILRGFLEGELERTRQRIKVLTRYLLKGIFRRKEA